MDQFETIDEIEAEALKRLSKRATSYYQSGGNAMVSLAENKQAFDKIKLKRAAEVDITKFKGTETEIFGEKIKTPICIVSTAFQRMAHPEGEVATAKAGESTGTPQVLSNWATSTIEQVGEAAPTGLKMLQIYLSKFPSVNKDIWQRAKDAGFKALCLTTDTQLLGKRERDVRLKFELPEHLDLQILAKYANQANKLEIDQSKKQMSGLQQYVANHKNNNIDWSIIKQVKEVSGMLVIPKGISNYEDARIAIEYGADAIFVSNHGARQLDTTPATIECLPEVVKAVRDSGKKIPIFFDGGVRKGSDVLKALAIGADLVLLGRPILYGLACDGQNGVERVLKIMNDELKEAMLHTGCMSISDAKLNPSLIYGDGESLFTNSFGMVRPKL